jgi:CheY-like chemotaxis protein
VLVADDQRMNRALLKRQLVKLLERVEVVEVDSGEAALAALLDSTDAPAEHGFDLAFLDEIYSAHSLRGIDITRQVRARRVMARSGAALPIIGCTGNERDDHNAAAIAAGQCAVWGQPLPTADQMRKQLTQLLVLEPRSQEERE